MKILASDFDNTTYYLDNDEQNKKNASAIKKYCSKNNLFCIITGRNYTDLKKSINEYDIPYDYLVCEDGAKIFNKKDECIYTKKIGKESIEKVTQLLKEMKCNYYLDDGYDKTENINDAVKIVIKCTNEEMKEKIVQEIKEKIDIHIYASRFHINIINKEVNKKFGINQLFSIEKLDYDSLYVIGDNDNDYEMLKEFRGAVIKKHHDKLNELEKEEYNYLEDYIEELMQD